MSESATVPYGPERLAWQETVSEVAVTEDGELLVRPPSTDPLLLDSYPDVPGITSALYQFPSSGLASHQLQQALKETSALVHEVAGNMLGFQGNEKFHYPILSELCNVHLDNEGDPFNQSKPSTTGDTKWLERNVLDYYASLWHAKWPHNPSDPDTYWGYIAPLGVSEANIFAVCTARDYLSGMFSISSPSSAEDPRVVKSYVRGEFEHESSNACKPVGFCSFDAHYSVSKGFQVCNVPSFHEMGTTFYPDENPLGGPWPTAVPCENGDTGPGRIDVEALTKLVDFFSGKGHPIIIVFNYGSTFKGAYDDVKSAQESILPVLKKNGMYELKIFHPESKEVITRKGFWFHVDGALSCSYMPFIEMGYRQGLIKEAPGPIFDFRLESVSSIATSIAKFIGGPWPSGIYLTRTGMQLMLPSDEAQDAYNVSESTFSCSRNGHLAVLLWSHVSSKSFEDQVRKISDMLRVADYAEAKLRALETELNQDLWVSRTRLSLAIYFRRPNRQIFRKYSLSAKKLYVNGEVREYCHIYVMHHVQRENIDCFITDLRMPGAF